METRNQRSADRLEARSGARSRDHRGTLATFGRSLRGVSCQWRDVGRGLSRGARGIERERNATTGTAPCRAASLAGCNHARNESEDQYDRGFLARPALRRANDGKESRLYFDRRADAQPGDRREYGGLQFYQRPVVQAPPRSDRAGAVGTGKPDIRRSGLQRVFVSRLP